MATLGSTPSTGELTDERGRLDSAAIRSRVWAEEPQLIVLHEIPSQSVASIDLMLDRVEDLAQPWPRFGYVVDLCDARRPSAEVRAELRRRTMAIRHRFIWVAIVVGQNVIMRAMARLVAYAMGLGPMSLHTTREEGIAKVRDVLAERESAH